MKLAKNIVLSFSAVFFIIGVHQTITLGFEVSYWIFMLSVSMFFLYTLIGKVEKDPNKKAKKKVDRASSKKGKRKKGEPAMNRQAKRHMQRMK